MAKLDEFSESELSPSYKIQEDGENVLSKMVNDDESHHLTISVDTANLDVTMTFTSRQAMYDFGRSLLHEAVYGQAGLKELYPLIVDGRSLVVDGARVSEGSSRVFIVYPSGSEPA
jgi:hypothetical protein